MSSFSVRCPCGARVHINTDDPELRWVRCSCGAEYSRTGETITPSPLRAAIGVFGRIFRRWPKD